MSNHDVLKVGTIFGAEAIGIGKDLGSLEKGKLADLVVLDRNPLENIRNTNTVRYVMKNGELYDGDTLDQVWPQQKKLPRQVLVGPRADAAQGRAGAAVDEKADDYEQPVGLRAQGLGLGDRFPRP